MLDQAAAPFGGWSQADADHGDTAGQQLRHLVADLRGVAGKQRIRYWTALFSASFIVVALYRIERALYLALGRKYVLLRAAAAPVRLLLRPLRHNCDLQYTAQIGRRFQVQHPNMGITISGRAVIGDGVIFAGGNALGSKHRGAGHGDVVIGNGVTLGMNSVVFGPLTIGDGAIVGAGAVVVGDVSAGQRVAGVPAKPVSTSI